MGEISLPHTAKVVKDLCVINGTFTEAINHDPAITYIQTGSQIPGRPSLGAWLSYGLGSMNEGFAQLCCYACQIQARRASLFNDFGEPDSCRPTIREFCLEVKKTQYCI